MRHLEDAVHNLAANRGARAEDSGVAQLLAELLALQKTRSQRLDPEQTFDE